MKGAMRECHIRQDAGCGPAESPGPVDHRRAVRDQLGLIMKSNKTPVDFLVIDSVEKVLAGN
jgi:uncharacterized protein (TIGR03435 family)